MNMLLFYFWTNLFFALANAYMVVNGKYPMFSAICGGVCAGAALFSLSNYING